MCLASQSFCATLCDPLDCSPPGSTVHGILQARTLECVTISSSTGASRPRNQTPVSCVSRIIGRFFITSATWEAQVSWFATKRTIVREENGSGNQVTGKKLGVLVCFSLGAEILESAPGWTLRARCSSLQWKGSTVWRTRWQGGERSWAELWVSEEHNCFKRMWCPRPV